MKLPGPDHRSSTTPTARAAAWPSGPLLAVGYPGGDAEAQLLGDRADLREFFSTWVRAGARILLAPTLNATPRGLAPLGMVAHTWEINRLALETVSEAREGTRPAVADAPLDPASCGASDVLIAGQLGPFGSPDDHDSAPFDRLYAQYHEQTKPLLMTGVDLVVIRNVDHFRLLRAALIATRELWSGPVVVSGGPYLSRSEGSCEVLRDLADAFDVTRLGISSDTGDPALEGEPGLTHASELLDLALPREAVVRNSGGDGEHQKNGSAPEASREEIEAAFRVGERLVLVDAAAPIDPIELPESSGETGVDRDGDPKSREARRAVLVPLECTDLILPQAVDAVLGLASGTLAAPSAPSERADASRTPCSWFGLDVSATAGLRSLGVAVEAAVSRLESRSGRPISVRARDARALELAAKASRSTPLLIWDGEGGDDASQHDCAVYLARRYGAISVVPLVSDSEATDVEEILARTRCRLADVGARGLPQGKIAVDITPLAEDPRAESIVSTLREEGYLVALDEGAHTRPGAPGGLDVDLRIARAGE